MHEHVTDDDQMGEWRARAWPPRAPRFSKRCPSSLRRAAARHSAAQARNSAARARHSGAATAAPPGGASSATAWRRHHGRASSDDGGVWVACAWGGGAHNSGTPAAHADTMIAELCFYCCGGPRRLSNQRPEFSNFGPETAESEEPPGPPKKRKSSLNGARTPVVSHNAMETRRALHNMASMKQHVSTTTTHQRSRFGGSRAAAPMQVLRG